MQVIQDALFFRALSQNNILVFKPRRILFQCLSFPLVPPQLILLWFLSLLKSPSYRSLSAQVSWFIVPQLPSLSLYSYASRVSAVLCPSLSIFSYAPLLRSYRKWHSELQMSSPSLTEIASLFPSSLICVIWSPAEPNQLLLCAGPYAGGINWPSLPLEIQLPLVLGKLQPTKRAFVISLKLSWSIWLKGLCLLDH